MRRPLAASEAGISLADAKKELTPRERRELGRSLKAYEKLAKQNADGAHDKILTKMSAAVHIDRLTALEAQMRAVLYGLYNGVHTELADGLKGFYADERERMAYEIQMARGKYEPTAAISEKRLSAVLKTPWATDGQNFSARLWKNRAGLVGVLQSELTRALITGADSASVAKIIAQKMNAAEYAASRLVQTELTRIITESDKDTFAEMGIDEIEIVGTLDGHTCGTCGAMDGKHMPRSDAKAGTTAPPFHPNCRCVIVPYFGDDEEGDARAMRDPETGKTVTAPPMTFKEWKEKYGSDGEAAKMKNVASKATNPPKVKENTRIEYIIRETEREKIFALHDLERGIIKKRKSFAKGEPLSIEEIEAAKGGKSWNFYDENGDLYLQVSDNDHGHKAEAAFGTHGEHCHWYYSEKANKGNRHGNAEEIPDYIRRAMGEKL